MNYKTWLAHERKWMSLYRKKTMRQMKYQTTPIVALSLGFIMVIRNFGRPMEIMLEYFSAARLAGWCSWASRSSSPQTRTDVSI